MKYSLEWLKNEIKEGKTFDYIYFWGHNRPTDNTITKKYFSQWFPQGFSENNVHYKTAEHYMMAQKATLFGDKEILVEIQDKTMTEQHQYLDTYVEEWKAGVEQVDDILIIGVRL